MHKRDDGDGDKLELLESVSSNAVQRKLSHDGGNYDELMRSCSFETAN